MVERSLLLATTMDGSAAGLNGRSLRLLLLLVLVLLLGPCIAVAPLATYPQVPHTMAEEDVRDLARLVHLADDALECMLGWLECMLGRLEYMLGRLEYMLGYACACCADG